MTRYFCDLIADLFILFPKRLYFFRQSLFSLFKKGKDGYHFYWRCLGLLLSLADLLGLPEWYEIASHLLKSNTRPLAPREKALAECIFGKQLRYKRIRIDEKAKLGPRQFRFCYVSFFTINSWGKITDDILIHELVHIWQYQQIGARYIALALMAQRTPEGYNYGGVKHLLEIIEKKGTLQDYNFEQQADIIMDYFRLKNDLKVRWGQATRADIVHYAYFVRQINPELAVK
ncbi:MAG: hypothetical protein R2828_00190 [Saprospiraceae bacterium]